jgi:uncharacterized protein (TIGR03118 family)
MKSEQSFGRVARWLFVVGLGGATMSPFAAHAGGGFYVVQNLVSDGALPAAHVDPNLVNSWGIAFPRKGDVMVADNGTGVATRYDGNGVPEREDGHQHVITIPAAPGNDEGANPTGVVFNPTQDFRIGHCGNSQEAAEFLFVSEDGTISAWEKDVDPDAAVVVVDNSASGANYKGVAIANNGLDNFLYAANFAAATVDVFDGEFHPVTTQGGFRDSSLPAGFAPFNVRNLNGALYVAFAKQGEGGDEAHGPGLGAIDIFDANGILLRRLVPAGGDLNAPWGMAIAPADFGRFSGDLIVGNFGDGRIHAYDIPSGKHEGKLKDAVGRPIVIDGLWGLAFGNGTNDQPRNVLFFAAGPNDEADGLYGRIEAR